MLEYAKTDSQGVVTEYPVYEHHIKNRGQLPRSYERVMPLVRPGHNVLTHTISKQIPVRNSQGDLQQVWQIDVKPLDMLRQHMTEKLAEVRWQHEIGGITLTNGMQLDTSRESQAMTNSAYNSLADGLITQTDWKGKNGWVVVTASELTPIAQALAKHVSACFGAERVVATAIEQADEASLLAMSLTDDFFVAYQSKMTEE